MELSRRKFLQTSAVGAAGLGISGIATGSNADPWYDCRQINSAIDNCRVVCCHDDKIVKQGSTFGTSFSQQNKAIDSARVHNNLDEMAVHLAQINDPAKAWEAIFQKPANKSWNQVKVAFKVNGINTKIMHHIAILDKLCKILNSFGVLSSNICVYDGCHSASGNSKYTPYVGNELPSGVIVSNKDQALGGKSTISIPGGKSYSCVKDIANGTIDIIVNCAVNKGHSVAGRCTLTLKNHIGTVKYKCPSNTTDLTNIFKSEAISGGTPPRQQLSIIDSICASKGGPMVTFDSMPHRIVMGVFGPAVDFLTVKKIREPIMKASHDTAEVNRFLTNFGYTTSQLNDLINKTPDQNGGKGWLEFTPGTTTIHTSGNPGINTKQSITFSIYGAHFKPVTRKIHLNRQKAVTGISIVDIKGRAVQQLPVGDQNRLAWDGLDAQGRVVSAGTYFVRISQTGSEQVIRFTLQK